MYFRRMLALIRILFMKKNLKYTLPALVLIAALAAGFSWKAPSDDQEKVVMLLVHDALAGVHYQPKPIDDAFSQEVMDFFLESLDAEKRFLQQSDMGQMRAYQNQLDDALKNADLTFFNLSQTIWQKRFAQSQELYQEILAQPLDFASNRSFETDAEKRGYAADDAGMRAYWTDYLTYRVLMRLYDRSLAADSAGQAKFTLGDPGFAEEEKKAREKEMEIHDEWFSSMSDMERSDWFGLYMNAYTGVLDPHTQYFPPRQQENFEIEMTGQLEGIGASLQQDGEFTTVASIVTGSACWRQGELEVGDKIIKVAQGSAEPEDIVGMSTNKVVTKVRGKKGTEVRLTVRKKDGTEKVIPIIRDIVEIEATFARSARLGADGKTGYIRLPKFYVDFYDDNNRNCADDVKKEIEILKAQGVERLIFDLRGNGGGSLPAAVDIAGLFFDKGPVVQVKTSGQRVRSYDDRAGGAVWDGPLLVMVNEGTASASEIVAAALQDYDKAIIVGTRQTFGKGTVQNMLDLDRAAGPFYGDKPLGALKLTIQKYYRITGGTTQLQGVESDVVLPHPYQEIPYGERELDYPLAVDYVEPAVQFEPKEPKPYLKAAQKRIAENPEFARISEYALWLKSQQDQTLVPLHYKAYFAREEAAETEAEAFDDLLKSTEVLPIAYAFPGQESTLDSGKVTEYTRWFKGLSTDMYLGEAYRIVGEMPR
jgi:carboxyl-terminal processing protease